MTSSPGPMFSAIRQASRASLPDETPIACEQPEYASDGLLTLLHFRSQDEVLGFQHFRDCCVNFGLDGCVLRLKIE